MSIIYKCEVMEAEVISVFFLLLAFSYNVIEASNTNFQVERFELCNNTQGLVKFQGNITKENGNQYLNFDVTSPIDWGDNVGFTCLIQSKTFGNNYVDLFTIREKNICKAANIYWGEFWYDIQRAAQMTPKACPLLAGRYHVHHMKLDFSKIALQTFPFGRLRFTIKAIDKRNPQNNMWCIFTEVENVLN